jgi:nicotinamidase-related amidase
MPDEFPAARLTDESHKGPSGRSSIGREPPKHSHINDEPMCLPFGQTRAAACVLLLWQSLHHWCVQRCREARIATIKAEPYAFDLEPARVALVIIDMQRDFLEPGGFGAALGNDVSQLRRAIGPTRRLLEASRAANIFVVHTREGHRPDLADLPPAKAARGRFKVGIGDRGPMGRILVRGEAGHDIIPELAPLPGEPVVDKPGKGAFHATDLDALLKNRGITQLLVCGVTTEVCVNTTVREANDRGYDCLVLEDCTGSYFAEFHLMGLRMIAAQGGIFGWVGESSSVVAALQPQAVGV